jgi:hypothetical protein
VDPLEPSRGSEVGSSRARRRGRPRRPAATGATTGHDRPRSRSGAHRRRDRRDRPDDRRPRADRSRPDRLAGLGGPVAGRGGRADLVTCGGNRRPGPAAPAGHRRRAGARRLGRTRRGRSGARRDDLGAGPRPGGPCCGRAGRRVDRDGRRCSVRSWCPIEP